MTGAKVRASALYLVIVIALVIGILCSALIVIAYYYHAEYLKTERYTRLNANLHSAVNILLAGQDTGYTEKKLSLFEGEQDSISVKRMFWGLYDINAAKAFVNSDTLYKSFSTAHMLDSAKWCVLYLEDNGRPIGLSGKTALKGDVFIPSAGINQAYVNNQAYSGDKRLFSGKRHNSEKHLPSLNSDRLRHFQTLIGLDSALSTAQLDKDSINRSFLRETMVINFKHQPVTLKAIRLSGNIILFSDTTLTIDSTASLQRVMVFAKAIIVQPGFKGNCQLFANDSVSVGKRCRFSYPSCLGVLRFGKGQLVQSQARVNIQDYAALEGTIFTYQEQTSEPQPIISIGKNVQISGQIYAQGTLQLFDNAEVDGSTFAEKFLYQTSFTRYENYLVNVTLDENALSPYYLTSALLPVAGPHKKVLEWIEGN